MWLLALTQGFLRMCRTMGWHGRLDQADGGGASGARIRNRKQRGKRTWCIGCISYKQFESDAVELCSAPCTMLFWSWQRLTQ